MRSETTTELRAIKVYDLLTPEERKEWDEVKQTERSVFEPEVLAVFDYEIRQGDLEYALEKIGMSLEEDAENTHINSRWLKVPYGRIENFKAISYMNSPKGKLDKFLEAYKV